MFDRRKEFEAALRAEGFDSDHYFQGAYADRYDDDFTQCRWEGWNLKCESVSAKPAPVADPVLCLSIAEDVVQTLSDSEPTERSMDGMDLLRGTPLESMLVLDGDEIRNAVALTLENAIHDRQLFTTAPELAVADEAEPIDESGEFHSWWREFELGFADGFFEAAQAAWNARAALTVQSRPPVQEGAQGAEVPQAIIDSIVAFDQFLNEPPEYEERRMVRDYRHEAYRKWDALATQLRKLFRMYPHKFATPGTGGSNG